MSIVSKKAFTVVELMAVITIIAILAGIVTVSFRTWQISAAQSAVKSDLKAAANAMENAKNFGTGYPLSIPSTFSPGSNVTVTYGSGSTTAFCLNGVSTTQPSVVFRISNGGSPISGSC